MFAFGFSALDWLAAIDRLAAALLVPVAFAILISGLDDMVVDAAWACAWLRSKLRPQAQLFPPGPRALQCAPQSPIAVLVPLWHEGEVIGGMLEHNLATIRYSNFHIFAGCYPNDSGTLDAVNAVAGRFANVHTCVTPHDGPTSKADCLNWVYQHMLLHEETTGEKFDVIVMHDAEDLIHPDELTWINYYAGRYDFVQTPVLPLATPLYRITHGVYCDEFAEYHTRDMQVRAMLGGFVPSSGVGTGFRREALEKLARSSSNRVFEPEALTEDYENGLKMFRLGCSQAFVPISLQPRKGGPDVMATREFFPQTWRSALRQRTRWVTGIALQGWERFGWRGKPGELYWLWRDRKGLLANPVSLLANALWIYGFFTGAFARMTGLVLDLMLATFAVQIVRMVVRIGCCKRIFGGWFAIWAPVRTVYGNLLNTCATVCALARYSYARLRGRPLKWLKTEHAYPNRAALVGNHRRLGEILVGSGYLSRETLETALAACPRGVRLGEYLVSSGALTEEMVYEALSLQQGLPVIDVQPSEVSQQVARALPERVAREWRVLPFKVAEGKLHVAAPEPPSVSLSDTLRGFTSLEIRFHLMTPSAFETLTVALL
jgi:bacteriophage N4 adsorption protein B